MTPTADRKTQVRRPRSRTLDLLYGSALIVTTAVVAFETKIPPFKGD